MGSRNDHLVKSNIATMFSHCSRKKNVFCPEKISQLVVSSCPSDMDSNGVIRFSGQIWV